MILRGIGASEGVAVAELFRLREQDLTVELEEGLDPAEQSERVESAKFQAAAELDIRYAKALEADPKTAEIFEIHRLMLDDPDFCEGVEGELAAGVNAEYAVRQTAEGLRGLLESMDDETMRARGADVTDVANLLIRILKGLPDEDDVLDRAVIVAAEDLLPSQTVRLDKSHVAGFLTRRGSVSSHAVILARTMGIPCIVAMGQNFSRLPEAGVVAMDGSTGELVTNPDGSTLADYGRRQRLYREKQELLRQYRDREAVTGSGHRVLVCANIGSLSDAELVKACGADGVGLFRSEFVYLESGEFPTEEAQFQIYRKVLMKLAPLQVVVRTLDLGSDKQAPYFRIPTEENPAMGYRAIRICLREKHIFRTQLRALLRASVFGNLSIMFPMVTGLGEVREIKKTIEEVRGELDAAGLPYSREIPLGIMVETPAAAVMSDVLAGEVDFFSIGTNDLTQYSMAADRMNPNVREFFDPRNPAVLRFIRMTAKNAHEAGIWVGICGESAADIALTEFYMACGIDELSVSPASVLKVKKAVIECG